MTTLLLGATGRTGIHIATRLHQAGRAFRVLVRDPRKQRVFTDMGAQVVLGDLSQDFSAALDGIDTVIYAAGSAESEGEAFERAIDRDAPIRAIDLAVERRMRRFVLISAISAEDIDRAPKRLRHYAQMKREADDHLLGKPIQHLILRPGVLSDERGRGRVALAASPTDRTPVAREDVAQLTVRALDLGVHGRIITFVGGDVPIDSVLGLPV
ncbi:MAG: SDR family oxidoreductase [Lautropia sp.]